MNEKYNEYELTDEEITSYMIDDYKEGQEDEARDGLINIGHFPFHF